MWDYDRMEFVPCTYGSKTTLTAGPAVAAVPLHSADHVTRNMSASKKSASKKRRPSRKDNTTPTSKSKSGLKHQTKKVRRSLNLSGTKTVKRKTSKKKSTNNTTKKKSTNTSKKKSTNTTKKKSTNAQQQLRRSPRKRLSKKKSR